MEIQLQELIEQIKKNGVEVAETEAEKILAEAKAEADRILSEAKAEAEKLMADAKASNERTVKVSEDAIRQAGRNLLISFRESVTKEMNAIIGDEVKSVYSSDKMADIIANVVKAWAEKSETEDITVLLGSADLERLEASLMAAMKEKMLGGVTFKGTDSFDIGFRVAVDGGRIHYDYSDSAVVEVLSAYLSPKVVSLLKEAE